MCWMDMSCLMMLLIMLAFVGVTSDRFTADFKALFLFQISACAFHFSSSVHLLLSLYPSLIHDLFSSISSYIQGFYIAEEETALFTF